MSFWLTFWLSLLDTFFAGARRSDQWNLWKLIMFLLCDLKEENRVVQDKLEDFKFSWWTLRIHKEGKSQDYLDPGPCFPAMFVFSCLFSEIHRQFRSAFLETVMFRRTLCVAFRGYFHAKEIISICIIIPPHPSSHFYTFYLSNLFTLDSAFMKSAKNWF